LSTLLAGLLPLRQLCRKCLLIGFCGWFEFIDIAITNNDRLVVFLRQHAACPGCCLANSLDRFESAIWLAMSLSIEDLKKYFCYLKQMHAINLPEILFGICCAFSPWHDGCYLLSSVAAQAMCSVRASR